MLVTFIILCMIIFSVLSLSSAFKDQTYSQKNADRVTADYAASNQAERILAKTIQNELKQEHPQPVVSYVVRIDDNEALQVVLTLETGPSVRYTVTTWKHISTTEWEGNQNLSVLGSD
jgi:hypothetical protein